MLNELLIIERGARRANLSMPRLHPDVKECRIIPTILVKLDESGEVASLQPVPREVKLWTLRDGQHNSFPFVQPKRPLLDLPDNDERRKNAADKGTQGRRGIILRLAEGGTVNRKVLDGWPGAGLLNRLRERREQLEPLTVSPEARALPIAIERFLLACESAGGPERLLTAIIGRLAAGLRQTAQTDWVDVATALLIGRFNAKRKAWECTGALLFDVSGAELSVVDPRVATRVSVVLGSSRDVKAGPDSRATCGLTGQQGPLSGKFPQPNLPVLGQTWIFAKNTEIPANDRYGRFASDAMPVGQDTAVRLAAALRALTNKTRKNVTWRGIPGEIPKQTDLLVAFVEEVPDAAVAGTLAELDAGEDFSEEAADVEQQTASSIAAFEKRTERLIEAVKGRVAGDFRQTPVRVAIFRKVDKANRKVVYARTPTVSELYAAASDWAVAEQNVPRWLRLPVPRKGEKKLRRMAPPHIAPLGLIPFSRRLFIGGGTASQDALGLPAAEALELFFDSSNARHSSGRQRAERILRLVLRRRGVLVQETAHATKRRFDALQQFDRPEALRTVTMLGLLLHKLARTKEVFMNAAAFKLGQLLAAADAVHAGYCADVRSGSLPPSLLGNQVFTMAQTAPTKALATLCRRWKPYDGWARKAARDRVRIDQLATSKDSQEKQRGWDIRVALRHAREMRALADQLAMSLPPSPVDDSFRAELLLGYIAGLPRSTDDDGNPYTKTNGKEEDA
jgi:hypothetical protein